MTQTQISTPHRTKKHLAPGSPTAAMTRKEALATLHKLHDAVGWHLYRPEATEEEKDLRKGIISAFRVLDTALHGEGISFHSSGGLCNFCYLRLSIDDLLVAARMAFPFSLAPCCSDCYEQLKAEQKIRQVQCWDKAEACWRDRGAEEW